MKKCNRKNNGILFIIFGIGIVFCLILPMRILSFLLAAIIIYAGFILLWMYTVFPLHNEREILWK